MRESIAACDRRSSDSRIFSSDPPIFGTRNGRGHVAQPLRALVVLANRLPQRAHDSSVHVAANVPNSGRKSPIPRT
jgi:hypothetical protein